MKNITYGYIRVSAHDQNEQRQIEAMREFGIEKRNIYGDKLSGKDFDRPGYIRVLNNLKPNDTLVIKSIDRLGRNYEEILEQWRIITKDKNAAIVVLDMPLLDTRGKKDLTGTVIADIVLQLLSYVAQTEREFIRQRQAEGIAAAKANGVKLGRRPKKPPHGFNEIKSKYMEGRISAREASNRMGITHKTFLKWVRTEELKAQEQKSFGKA
ncbi:MAG: recombinase family protein [Clostridia bacterium]|nr:recombinase family protein [Clostridia bacterium]